MDERITDRLWWFEFNKKRIYYQDYRGLFGDELADCIRENATSCQMKE
jgi:hypothetical protein